MNRRLASAFHVVVALSMLGCGNADPSAAAGSSSAKPPSSSTTSAPVSSSSAATLAPSASSNAGSSLADGCLEAARAFVPLVMSADDALVDRMPDDAVAEGGGRAEFLKALAATRETMKTQGLSIEAATIDPPTKVITNEGRTFAILPSRVTVKTPKERLRRAGFLVGVSDDDGKSWRFLDGTNPSAIRKLKKFPSSLVLPEPQKPETL